MLRHLPEIVGLPFQPLQIPGGWIVMLNHFYQLDPDDDLADRNILHLPQNSLVDPWNDVLCHYFDYSSLWFARRLDHRYQITLDWIPMGQRDGHFTVQQYQGTPIHFTHPPDRTLKQQYGNIQITYDLNNPVIWADEPQRTFESRDRELIAATLNQWLVEASGDWLS